MRTPFSAHVVRHRAMIKTTGEAVQLYKPRNRKRVEQQARAAGHFMGVPMRLDRESGDRPLEDGEL